MYQLWRRWWSGWVLAQHGRSLAQFLGPPRTTPPQKTRRHLFLLRKRRFLGRPSPDRGPPSQNPKTSLIRHRNVRERPTFNFGAFQKVHPLNLTETATNQSLRRQRGRLKPNRKFFRFPQQQKYSRLNDQLKLKRKCLRLASKWLSLREADYAAHKAQYDLANPNDKELLILELIKDPYIKAWLKTSIVTGIHHQTMVEMAEIRSKQKIRLDGEESKRLDADNALPPL